MFYSLNVRKRDSYSQPHKVTACSVDYRLLSRMACGHQAVLCAISGLGSSCTPACGTVLRQFYD